MDLYFRAYDFVEIAASYYSLGRKNVATTDRMGWDGRYDPRKEGNYETRTNEIAFAYPVCKSHRDYEPREKQGAGIGERALGSLVCHGTLYLIVQLRANP